MASFVRVANRSEIPTGAGKCVEVNGRRIALFNLGGEIYAIDDECTHSGGPLSEGFVDGEEIECPWHSARFSIRTGEVLSPPAFDGVTSYRVRIAGDEVEVEI
jgi:nitrite reductase/ring-hydroxylating ferredoxin subunit